MKVAISLPDPLFETGERIASRLKISRSQLYARALEAFFKEDQRLGIREALEKVYADELSSLDPLLEDLQAEALREDW